MGKGLGALALKALPLAAIGITISAVAKAFTPLNENIKQVTENLENLNAQKVSEDFLAGLNATDGISSDQKTALYQADIERNQEKSFWSNFDVPAFYQQSFQEKRIAKNINKFDHVLNLNQSTNQQKINELTEKINSTQEAIKIATAIDDKKNLDYFINNLPKLEAELKKLQQLPPIEILKIEKTAINEIDKQIKDSQIAIDIAINKGDSQNIIDELKQNLADLQNQRNIAINEYIPDYGQVINALKGAETLKNELINDFQEGKINATTFDNQLQQIQSRINSLTGKIQDYDNAIKANIENIKKMAYALYEVNTQALALENSLNIQQLTANTQILNQRSQGEIGDITLQKTQTDIEAAIAKSRIENNGEILRNLQGIFQTEISKDTRRRIGELLNLRGEIENNIQKLSPEIIDLAMNANSQLLENHPELQQALTILQEISKKRIEGINLENRLAQAEVARRKETETMLNRQLTNARKMREANFQESININNSNNIKALNELNEQRISQLITPEIASVRESFINLEKIINDNSTINKRVDELNKILNQFNYNQK